jgi:hypothetical protein
MICFAATISAATFAATCMEMQPVKQRALRLHCCCLMYAQDKKALGFDTANGLMPLLPVT